MGAKPSNFNQMNAMATDRKSRVNDEGTRTEAKHQVAGSEQLDEGLIPNTPENPEQAQLRAMKAQQRDEE
jgi:hypothetical protein